MNSGVDNKGMNYEHVNFQSSNLSFLQFFLLLELDKGKSAQSRKKKSKSSSSAGT